ncbi:MAG: type IV toxin-antitoxin system AbiEi family antitoxin, partial [Bacteriovorax sp.]
KNYSQTAAIQRLGYLLDKELDDPKLSEPLLKILSDRNYAMVALSADKVREGESDDKWKVIKNTKIESDL